MSMPTKTRFQGSIRPILAVLCALMLGACAGESTGPQPSGARSGFSPDVRKDGGYAALERGDSTIAMVQRKAPTPTQPVSTQPVTTP